MLRRFLHLILPHRCFKCDVILEGYNGLCSTCWAGIHFISKPYCAQCGYPLEIHLGDGAICGQCAKGENALSHVRSLFVYDEMSKGLILKLKHGDALHSAPFYGEHLSDIAADVLEESQILCPVPLHWSRLLSRSYNQSHVLGKEIAKRRPRLDYLPRLLRRHRATESQGRLTTNQRFSNIQGSISLDKQQKNRIKGKRIVLVDDVMTSGATLNTCAKVLLRSGAERVDAITLGRVTRG